MSTTTLRASREDASDVFSTIPVSASHVHRWRIEEPAGPNSRGSCVCGETRAFANSFDDGPSGWRAFRAARGNRNN